MRPGKHRRRRQAMPLGNPEANFFDRSIYEPPPASPRHLPPQHRAIWDRAYAKAVHDYTAGGDEIPNLEQVAQRSAWRTLDAMRLPSLGSRRVPTDADVIVLGRLLEYSFVDPRGVLQIRSMPEPDPPELLWDHARKLLYCFPQIEQHTSCDPIPPRMREQSELYHRWAQRDPHCYANIEIPAYTVYPAGLADTVTYRSDKWHKQSHAVGLGDATPYIHDLGTNVWCWLDEDDPPNVPRAIVIGGGKLDMHEKGLIH